MKKHYLSRNFQTRQKLVHGAEIRRDLLPLCQAGFGAFLVEQSAVLGVNFARGKVAWGVVLGKHEDASIKYEET